MTKQLNIADIDSLIAKLEQGYSNSGHTLNALAHQPVIELSEAFKQQYIYISQAQDNDQRLIRFEEVVAGLSEEEKWPFMESFAAVIKTLSTIDNESEGLDNQASQLLNANGYEVNKDSVPYRVLLSKLSASNNVRDELLSSIFQGDGVGERELKSLLETTPVQQVIQTEVSVPESTGHCFHKCMSSSLTIKLIKKNFRLKYNKITNVAMLFG